jgi:osmotically-inducible protein OsmY
MHTSDFENGSAYTCIYTPSPCIGRAVEDRLRSSGYRSLRDISCHEFDGVAHMHGSLPSYYAKQLAQEIASRVDGVRLVINNIKVTLPNRRRQEA